MVLAEEIRELLEELSFVLEREGESLVPAYTGEESPAELEFAYQPSLSSSTASSRSGRKTSAPSEHREVPISAPPVDSGELPDNVRCTLCADRMYPVKQFRRRGRLPVLVLYYNGSFQDSLPRRDRSDRYLLGNPEEGDLFRRMVEAAGWQADDLHYQEYPGCHFNPDRSQPEEWNERCRNCLVHVEATLQREGIRLLLLTGPAALFLLGEEKAKEHARSGEPIPLPFEAGSLPALVLRSPAALLAYERKREALKREGTEEAVRQFEKVKKEESQVKKAVLSVLQRARETYL